VIDPKISHLVWFWRWDKKNGYVGPMTAFIAGVTDPTHVDLIVLEMDVQPYTLRGVPLQQPEDPIPVEQDYCEWAPHALFNTIGFPDDHK
jgi:hypothetical protein